MTKTALRHAVVISFLVLIGFSATLTVPGQQTSVPAPRQQTALPRSAANTGTAPLNIGGATFRIGMSRQEAMSLVAECCGTSAVSSDGMFLLNKASNEIIGAIFFKDGRVSGLRRDEKQSQNKEVADFILSLYRSVLDRNSLIQPSVVTLSAFSEELSNATSRHLTLTFPDGRRLHLTQSTLDNGEVVVDLQEER
jgi:hypothetical protein